MVKQVIVLRTDLNMRKGKMAAQAAHASMKVFFDGGHFTGEKIATVFGPAEKFQMLLGPEVAEWVRGLFTKIVVGIDSEEGILELRDQAYSAGLPFALIEDAGNTEFHGVKTITALAIGPAKAEDIDKITGELKLL